MNPNCHCNAHCEPQLQVELAAINRLENKAHLAAVKLATEMDMVRKAALKQEALLTTTPLHCNAQC